VGPRPRPGRIPSPTRTGDQGCVITGAGEGRCWACGDTGGLGADRSVITGVGRARFRTGWRTGDHGGRLGTGWTAVPSSPQRSPPSPRTEAGSAGAAPPACLPAARPRAGPVGRRTGRPVGTCWPVVTCCPAGRRGRAHRAIRNHRVAGTAAPAARGGAPVRPATDAVRRRSPGCRPRRASRRHSDGGRGRDGGLRRGARRPGGGVGAACGRAAHDVRAAHGSARAPRHCRCGWGPTGTARHRPRRVPDERLPALGPDQ